MAPRSGARCAELETFVSCEALSNVSKLPSQSGETVLVELPGLDFEAPRKLAGTISAATGRRLVILSPEKISASSAIRVQGQHLLYLGDVLESTLDADGQWTVHVSVKNKFMIF
jgi:hypothetical protein